VHLGAEPFEGRCHTERMSTKGRGPAPKMDPLTELVESLKASFRWRGDRTDDLYRADPTGWWAGPDVLARLGPAMAALFCDEEPTVVLGLQSRGRCSGHS
jgi:hypothetical protein